MSFPYYRGIQIFVPMNAKIADISETDTNKHTLTLANAGGTGAIAGETRKIISITMEFQRVSGSGYVLVYPNEGTYGVLAFVANQRVYAPLIIKDGTQRMQYNQSAAGEDWDVYCYGYVVEA